MKVLIIHQHFKTPQSGGAIRSYYLARALVEKGIETVVITAHNEGVYRAAGLEGIQVHYLPVAYDNRFGFYRRVFSFYWFVVKTVRMASLHRNADLCYTISTPLTTGLAAMWIRRRYGIPYIFEVGDLWPDAPVQMGFVKNPLVRSVLYRIEKRIYRHAASIVALSGPIRDAVLKKAPDKMVHVIPNMADTEFFKPDDKQRTFEEEFGVQGKFVVSYIGALGVANGLHYFLDCAAASQRENLPVHFLLCGDGARIGELKSYAGRLQLKNLTVIPFRNRDGVREVMNVTDANFISYLPVKILETGSPNKYFDGLAAGKLTMINFQGWIREEIERERCGVHLDKNDADDFVRKIKPFLDDEVMLKNYQAAGRALAEKKYSRAALGKRFWEIVTGKMHEHSFRLPRFFA